MPIRTLTIKVRDSAGDPVSGAKVSVTTVDEVNLYPQQDYVNAPGESDDGNTIVPVEHEETTPSSGDISFRVRPYDELKRKSLYAVSICLPDSVRGTSTREAIRMPDRDVNLGDLIPVASITR